MKFFLSLVLGLLVYVCSGQDTKYLYCGFVLDCVGNSAQSQKTIIIRKNEIMDIRDGYISAPDSVMIVD